MALRLHKDLPRIPTGCLANRSLPRTTQLRFALLLGSEGEGFKTLKIHAVGHQLYRGMDTWHRLAFKCNKVAKYCDLAVELKLAGHNGVIGTQMKNGSVRLIKLGQPLENIILTPSHDGKTLDYVLIANNKTLVGHAVLHRVTVK